MIVGPNDPHHPLLGTSTWILHSTARISTAAAVGGGGHVPRAGRCLPSPPQRAGRPSGGCGLGKASRAGESPPLLVNRWREMQVRPAAHRWPHVWCEMLTQGATALRPKDSPDLIPHEAKSGSSLNTLPELVRPVPPGLLETLHHK